MPDMLGRDEAVSAGEALRLILESLPMSSPPETLAALEESYGRVLARDVVSPEDLPGFARSTMDGFALSSADTFGASEGSPAYIVVRGEIPMGREPDFELARGEAARISTGGMLPKGADAVLMLEHAQRLDGDEIEALRSVAPGENVMQRGEDARKGEVVLKKGRRLRHQDVAALAGLGITEVPVYDRPRVSIISTGDEIVPPATVLRPGLVRDTNSYDLAGLVLEEGGVPLRKGILRDDYGLIRGACESAVEESDIVLVTGGSSVGSRDMTAGIIAELGRVLFHSVSIKPGKPLIAGVANGKPVFGIPGHPRAVGVCFNIFIRPVLRLRAGAVRESLDDLKGTVSARLTKNVRSAAGREEHFSVAIDFDGDELLAVPLPGKSGLITNAVKADGTICVPLGSPGFEKGASVRVRLY
jgi:molybdopterin molybdotransferase